MVACTVCSLLLSGKVVDCSGNSLGLQEVRGCSDTSDLVAGGLAVLSGAARCEHTHGRRVAGTAGSELCPLYQGLCPRRLLSGAVAASFHRQHATGANPGVQSCLMPCRKAVCLALVAACCMLAG